MAILFNGQKPTQKVKENEETEEYVLNEIITETSSEKVLNETEISDLPNQEFKITVIKMLTMLRKKKMDVHSKNFNREMKIVRKYQMELKKIIKVKNTLEGFNSRLDEAIEKIRELKDREMELI